jgi:PAS domain S-box-containing protein
MWVYDLETLRFLAVNDTAIADYGYSREEFLSMTIRGIRPPEDWNLLEVNVSRSQGLLQRSGDWRHQLKSGETIVVEIWSNVIDFDGRTARLVIAHNITEQRALEHRLQESEQRFRTVAQVTTDVIWDWSAKEDRTWYSDGLEKMFGYSLSDGEHDSSFWLRHIHPEDMDRVFKSTSDAITRKLTCWVLNYRFLKKDGSVAQVEDNAHLIYGPDGDLVRLVGGMTDVSARKADEARLAQQAALLDKAQDAIVVHDVDNRIVYWNHSAERIYGWSKNEALGHSIAELLSPEREQFAEAAAVALSRGEWSGRIAFGRKDGTRITVEGSWTLVEDENGNPQSILAIASDVTSRLALEEQLRQSQRLEAIGKLTGGVAHDFNNLLTIIVGNSELLVEQLAEGDPRRVLAEMTMSAAQRGAELTTRLLAFSRRQPLAPQIVDINALVVGMDSLLTRAITADIVVRIVPSSSAGTAMVDPAQLEAAILNLCINARDAMPDGGTLTLETGQLELDDQYVKDHTDMAAGPYVAIAVSDTGTGIAPNILSRVFEPFFTTKDVGKGTGLGLSMVYGFAQQSGGQAKIYSEVGHGTTVKLYLPRIQSSSERVCGRVAGGPIGGSGETILLVEDEQLVRHHVSTQLDALGYRAISVANATEAMDVIGQRTDIDLLFTDVVMPGAMNGRQLADAARAMRPGLAVLYTSGYAENAIAHGGRLEEGVLLLSKPYSRSEMANKVRSALRRSAATSLGLEFRSVPRQRNE